jgi:hypothetical protein
LRSNKIIVNVIIVLLCGLASGIGLIERFNIKRFAEKKLISYLTPNSLIIFIICFFSVLLFWWLFSLLISRISGASFFEVLRQDSYSFLPLLLFLIFTLSEKPFFFGLKFFQENNDLLLAFCAVGIAYLKMSYIKKLLKKYSNACRGSYLKRIRSFFFHVFIDGKRWKLNLFLITFFIYLLLASGIFFPIFPATGDEPHYLVETYSILKDHDLEVSNNYYNKDYYTFYPIYLHTNASRGKVSSNLKYPVHPPGFSLWLLAFFYLGQFLNGRWLFFLLRGSICFLTAFLSVYTVDLSKDIFHDKKIALLSWLAISFTSPILFYSRHLYPEVPAALLSLLVIRAIRKLNSLNWQKMLAVGAGIGLIPWLGQKFINLTVALILVVLFYIWKNKALLSSKMLFAIPLLLLIGLYFFYIYTLYGDFSPMSIKLGYQTPKIREEWNRRMLLNSEIKPKIACLMSYFIDQKEGLLIYSPIYLFSFIGFYALMRYSRSDFWLLLWLLGAHIGTYSYLHETSGFCPPTRPLMGIIWIIGIFLAAGFKFGENRWVKSLRRDLLIASFIIALLLSLDSNVLYQGISKNLFTPSSLYLKLSNLYIDFTKLLPSLLDIEILSYKVIIFWVIAISFIVFCLFLLSRKKEAPEGRDRVSAYSISIILTMVMVIIGAFLFCLFPRFHLDRLSHMEFLTPKTYKIYSLDGNIWGPELGGLWVKGKIEARFILQTSIKAKQLLIKMRSPVNQDIKISGADFCCSKEIKIKGKTSLTFTLSKPLLFKKSWLYLINIKTQSGYSPYKSKGSKDSRYLGVFVKLKPIFITRREWIAAK